MSDKKKNRGFKIDLLEHNNTRDKIHVDQCLHFLAILTKIHAKEGVVW